MFNPNRRLETMDHITKTEALLEIAKAINTLAIVLDGINFPRVPEDHDDETVEF